MNSTNSTPSNFFDSSSFLAFIFKWKKQVLIVGFVAAIVSSIVSFFIEPKFKSTVILYPTTTVSISKTLLKEWDDVLKFGEEKEAEQIIQILNSDFVRDKLSEKFNLLHHFGIDPHSPFKNLYLKGEFDDRFTSQRTPYNSIDITVYDQSPDTAALIANYAADLIDSLKNKLYKERARQAYQIVSDEYEKKKLLVKKLEDSLLVYTKQGIFDYEKQSGIIFKEYSKSIRSSNKTSEDKLDQKMKLMGATGWKYASLRDNAYYERNQLFLLKTKYDQARVDVEKMLPSKYVITPAVPAEKKTYPVRWLIVVVSTISALLFSIVIISILEKTKSTGLLSMLKKKA